MAALGKTEDSYFIVDPWYHFYMKNYCKGRWTASTVKLQEGLAHFLCISSVPLQALEPTDGCLSTNISVPKTLDY